MQANRYHLLLLACLLLQLHCNRCGNGTLDRGEECDDSNLSNTDACLDECLLAFCGDGFVQEGIEACDGFDIGVGCSADCSKQLICGDGVLDANEQCDDGNLASGDGCDLICFIEKCGDGFLDFPQEECDDGNQIEGDGCDSFCFVETASTCGNGVVNFGEDCDDGNQIDNDGCNADCTLPPCGDGIVDANEECDDGNDLNLDGCEAVCKITPASCENGIRELGEICFQNVRLPLELAGLSSVAEDYDGDGDLDIAIFETVTDTVGIFLNNGGASFSLEDRPALLGTQPNLAAAADFDGDGDIDLAVACRENVLAGVVNVLYNDGRGKFPEQALFSTIQGPNAVTTGDFDADGDIDIAAVIPAINALAILLNDGAGQFDNQAFFSTAGDFPNLLLADDLDGDADLDIVVSNLGDILLQIGGSVEIFLDQGGGLFDSQGIVPGGLAPFALAALDADNDGDSDLMVGGFVSGEVRLLFNNNAAFNFQQPFLTEDNPIFFATGDFDGVDGVDLVTTLNDAGTLGMFFHEENSFQQMIPFGTQADSAIHIISGDFNGDTFDDIAVTVGGQTDEDTDLVMLLARP